MSTKENPNINCLQGMSCPACECFGPFEIEVTVSTSTAVADEGTDLIRGNVEWEETSSCKCSACGHTATVQEFRGEPAPCFNVHQRLLLAHFEEGRFASLTPSSAAHSKHELLKHLLYRLSTESGCDSFTAAVARVDRLVKDLTSLHAVFEAKFIEKMRELDEKNG